MFGYLLFLQSVATRLAWDFGYLFSHVVSATWIGHCDWCGDSYADDPKSDHCDYCETCCDGQHALHCSSCSWSTFISWDLCDACHNCESCCTCNEGRCQCLDCQSDASGLSVVAPWASRGVTVPPNNVLSNLHYREVWGFDETTVDPVRVFADFYLCEAMANTTFHEVSPRARQDAFLCAAVNEASDRVDRLCATDLPALTAYLKMVVWGEARYHRAVTNSVVMGGRKASWNIGKSIVNAVGPDAYRDLRDLFNEQEEGAYGGPRWGAVCDLLWRRETGMLPDRIWLDRICTLQHNGGPIWNKVQWLNDNPACWGVEAIPAYLGPAQANNPTRWEVLLCAASPSVVALWDRWFARRQRYSATFAVSPSNRVKFARNYPHRVLAGSSALSKWDV